MKKLSKQYIDKTLPFKKPTIASHEVDLTMLEDGLIILAGIVNKYGDHYLPAFARIHTEIEKRKKLESYKDIALQIATDDIK